MCFSVVNANMGVQLLVKITCSVGVTLGGVLEPHNHRISHSLPSLVWIRDAIMGVDVTFRRTLVILCGHLQGHQKLSHFLNICTGILLFPFITLFLLFMFFFH